MYVKYIPFMMGDGINNVINHVRIRMFGVVCYSELNVLNYKQIYK